MSEKALILNEIQGHLKFGKDADFARFLGITPQTLSNWKSRGTFDMHIVYTKCLFLNPHWLITGEGQMLKNQLKNEYTPPESRGAEYFSEPLDNPTPPHKLAKLSPKTGEKLSPTLSPTQENCRVCDEKERIIASMQNTIDAQYDSIRAMKKLLEFLHQEHDSSKKQAG